MLLYNIKKKLNNVEIVINIISFFFIVICNFSEKIKITKINKKEFISLLKGVKKFNNKAINDAVITPIRAL
jgi:hypothetical protein